jgi:ABC-type nitrate/sulfonate/bicarbonate transport system substrate-binding protein
MGVTMLEIARTFLRMASLLFSLLVMYLVTAQPALALEEALISYAGPSITFLPAEVARQRGFFREQNLDVKLLLTRTEVDRAALASGNIDYTLRAGSTFVSAARGLPVRIVFLSTTKPFWGLVVRQEIKSVSELKGNQWVSRGCSVRSRFRPSLFSSKTVWIRIAI